MNDTQPRSPSSPTEPASQPHPRKFNFWRWFWLTFLVVSLSWAWHDFYVPANNVNWASDYATAQQQAARSGRPMILFFTATWCAPCRIMKRTVWADKQVEAEVNAAFTPVLIDVNDPGAADALSRYRIGATPTTIFTDPQGKVLERVDGGMGKTDFLAVLARLNPSATAGTR